LNDLDQRIVNLYRVLQDREKFRELLHRLIWTPYSRAEFARALEILKDPEADEVSRAWAFFVVQNQGFSGKPDVKTAGRWGRSLLTTNRGMAETTNKWRVHLRLLSHWHQRLSRVQIDSVDALQAIRYWDTPDTVFYVDPPYVPETRGDYQTSRYRHEFELEDHQRLVETLLQVRGKVLLSGYDHSVYRSLEEAGWHKVMREVTSHAVARTRVSGVLGPGSARAKAPRTEVLWMNFKPEGLVLEAPLQDK
jgi:DNA adenine methylase